MSSARRYDPPTIVGPDSASTGTMPAAPAGRPDAAPGPASDAATEHAAANAETARNEATSSDASAAIEVRRTDASGPEGSNDASAFRPNADSVLADSLPNPFIAADSLDTAGMVAADNTPWRDTTTQAVYGTQSRIVVPQRVAVSQTSSLTDNAVFQGFVLLLAATYGVLLYRNLADVGSLLDRVSRDRASAKRLTEESGGSGFSRFLHIATTIGMLFMGVMVVKYGDSLMPRSFADALSHGAVVALSLAATSACVAVAAFQTAILRSAGALTLTQSFVSQLLLLKRTYFSLAVIVSSPALLLFALCPRGTGDVWFCIIVVELIVTAVLYLRETLNLFLAKKVSILHWFLYLCGVEVFPISLLWLLAVR